MRFFGSKKRGYITMRLGYKYRNVLIESSRVLDSPFPSVVLQMTGGQVEMLRNLAMYLHREDTFVATYGVNYYETPNATDFDDIQAMVADLEKQLMGDGNVIFGYNERYLEQWANASHASGMQLLETMPVPAGYIYVVEQISMLQVTTAGSYHHLKASDDTDAVFLGYWSNTVAGVPSVISVHTVLKEDDYIRATWGNTATDEYLVFTAWGYKMKVDG